MYDDLSKEYNVIAVSGGSLTGCLAAKIMLNLNYPIIYDNNSEIADYFDVKSTGATSALFVINDQLNIEWSAVEGDDITSVVEEFALSIK